MQLRQPAIGELLSIQFAKISTRSQTTCISTVIIVGYQKYFQGKPSLKVHIYWSNNILLSINYTKNAVVKQKEPFLQKALLLEIFI
jgi:hypothetical protein